MNVKEVKDAVIGFGYTYDLEGNDTLFLSAIDMAVREINRIRPRTATAVIVHEPYAPVYSDASMHTYTPTEALTFSSMARSAIFEVDGAGSVTVSGAKIDGLSAITWNAESSWKRLVAVADGKKEITLTFSGEYTYHVRNVSFYEEATTIGLKYGEYMDYDLAGITSDFQNLRYVMRNSVDYTRYRLINGTSLRIPVEDTGTFEVNYIKKISIGTDEKDGIPLDDDLASLVPLLTASYIWLEDNPERAQYYRALYERQAAMIRPETVNVRVVDRRRWS